MARQTIVTTFSIEPVIWQRLNDICAKTGIKKSTLVNRLLEEAMDGRLVTMQAMQHESFQKHLMQIFASPDAVRALGKMIQDGPITDAEAQGAHMALAGGIEAVLKNTPAQTTSNSRRSIAPGKLTSAAKIKVKGKRDGRAGN